MAVRPQARRQRQQAQGKALPTEEQPDVLESASADTARKRAKSVGAWDESNWDEAEWATREVTGEAVATSKERHIEPEEPTSPNEATQNLTPTVKPHAISDQAVENVTQDSLGFRPYVDALVRFLRAQETQPPLAIAVGAPWGRGKTSFMQMIDTELRLGAGRSVRFATTWFNPWKCSTREEVWTAYVTAVTECLRGNLGFQRRLLFSIKRYWTGLKDRGRRADFFLRVSILAGLVGLFTWVVVSPSMAALAAALVETAFEDKVASAMMTSLGGALPWLGGIVLLYFAYVHV
jgi:hypothetical protein